MNKETVSVEVGEHVVEVSSLEKILYPSDGIIKAEVLAYYVNVAPFFLRHSRGRPVAIIRFPDGIDDKRFFQKNRPDWAPKWIHHADLGEEKKIDYVILTEASSIVWLANLAALELHTMMVREPYLDRPDMIAFDIDPPTEQSFSVTIDLAFSLKTYLERFGYTSFVKTSGQKGLHVVMPIEQRWDVDTCFAASKKLAEGFVRKNRGTTLQLNKTRRQGKTLIDIYRNGSGQTMVAPYSLRGKAGAPVSMPVHWEFLPSLESAASFNLQKVVDYLNQHGDVWESIKTFAAPLHTEGPVTLSRGPELTTYREKRNFSRTTEPMPNSGTMSGSRFVVQRHHASRLHYDVRLEENGILRSWAIPKGLPPRPGIRRRAAATEDHPLDYLEFEGTIPRGEYGGGSMWVFARGRFERMPKPGPSLHFRLYGDGWKGEYALYPTKDQDWMMERFDEPGFDWLRSRIDPMKAVSAAFPSNDQAYLYEVKWDGIRAIVFVDEGRIRIQSRNGLDLTDRFPELLDAGAFRSVSGVFDGEIVCLDEHGRPRFDYVLKRLKQRSGFFAKKATATCYLFDCLYLDGKPVVDEPLARRKEWLADTLKHQDRYRLSLPFDDGRALFAAVQNMGLEGIVAKLKSSRYEAGERSSHWLKIKVVETTDCFIVGFTMGVDGPQGLPGAFHLAEVSENRLIYRGKVGTGFTSRQRATIQKKLQALPPLTTPIAHLPVDSTATWVEPVLACEVKYDTITPSGSLRAPVFRRLRSDIMNTDLLTSETI